MDKLTNFVGNLTGNDRRNEDGTRVINTPMIVPILPMRLQGQMPPLPPPPTQFMTDAEIHLNRQNNRLAETQKHGEELDKGLEDLTGSGKSAGTRAKGLWGVVAGGVKKGFTEAQIAGASTVQSTTNHSQLQRYHNAFPHVAQQGAEFHSSHFGSVVHQGRQTPISAFVTSTHLCVNGSGLTDAVPYLSIVSIIPCVSLVTTDLTPFLMPIPNPSVIPTGLEVYVQATNVENGFVELLKYQFLGFGDSVMKKSLDSSARQHGPCIKFLADLDKSWRHCAGQVPRPDVQYQDGYGAPVPPVQSSQPPPAAPSGGGMGGFFGQMQARDLQEGDRSPDESNLEPQLSMNTRQQLADQKPDDGPETQEKRGIIDNMVTEVVYQVTVPRNAEEQEGESEATPPAARVASDTHVGEDQEAERAIPFNKDPVEEDF